MNPQIPSNPLHGAILQLRSGEDFAENLKQIINLVAGHKDHGSWDLVVVPENAFFFRVGEDKKAYSLDDPIWQELQNWVDKMGWTFVVGGNPTLVENQVYNSTLVFRPHKKVEEAYRKIHLFDVDVEGSRPLRESDQFSYGERPATLTIKGWEIGLSICYDIRFSELYGHYSKMGVHALLVPAAFLVPTGKAHWHVLLRGRAIETQAFVLAPAQGGEHKSGSLSRFTYGHSLVVDPWGEVLEEATEDHPQVLSFTLDPQRIHKVRRQIPMANHRRLSGPVFS
ncbi:MAG: carbon-nitrogen hydrolase family protein [Bdellovibrionales bacterium]|nr:carbon-nitrogen hydrolase family protein [Bdellovibrionales bacterium]